MNLSEAGRIAGSGGPSRLHALREAGFLPASAERGRGAVCPPQGLRPERDGFVRGFAEARTAAAHAAFRRPQESIAAARERARFRSLSVGGDLPSAEQQQAILWPRGEDILSRDAASAIRVIHPDVISAVAQSPWAHGVELSDDLVLNIERDSSGVAISSLFDRRTGLQLYFDVVARNHDLVRDRPRSFLRLQFTPPENRDGSLPLHPTPALKISTDANAVYWLDVPSGSTRSRYEIGFDHQLYKNPTFSGGQATRPESRADAELPVRQPLGSATPLLESLEDALLGLKVRLRDAALIRTLDTEDEIYRAWGLGSGPGDIRRQTWRR